MDSVACLGWVQRSPPCPVISYLYLAVMSALHRGRRCHLLARRSCLPEAPEACLMAPGEVGLRTTFLLLARTSMLFYQCVMKYEWIMERTV